MECGVRSHRAKEVSWFYRKEMEGTNSPITCLENRQPVGGKQKVIPIFLTPFRPMPSVSRRPTVMDETSEFLKNFHYAIRM